MAEPPRGIVSVTPILAAGRLHLRVICDCGGIIELFIEDPEQITEDREIAVTCDGCQSSHWLTITPTEGGR